MKQLALSLLVGLIAFGAVAIPATAITAEQEQEQKAEQKTETICETGQYGTCRVVTEQKVEQKQRQKILAAKVDVRESKVHVPVDTALDAKSLMSVVGMTVVGGVAYVARRRMA